MSEKAALGLKAKGHEEREKLETLRHQALANKFEAEEHYQAERLGFVISDVESWIPQSVQHDIKQLRQGTVPIHLEVIARITVSSFLGYVLALESFPNVIPESQRVLIAMLGSTLGMLFPTLIFSIGLIMFPAMIFVCLLGLVLATLLLSCAAGVGLGFYTFIFGFTALVISGMRFDKKTGAMTCFLVVEMALNSQPLARFAADSGMDFVKSLWTERGVTNPKALYTNTLVGMMWIIFVMIVGRILPPFRTARSGIVKGLLPASLKNVAASIDLNAEDLQLRLKEQTNGADDGVKGSTGTEDSQTDADDLKKRREQLVAQLIHYKSSLANGSIAGLTAFEPRLFRFGPPECSWMVLKALCTAIDRTVLASLALSDAWQDPQELSTPLEQQLLPSQRIAAETLRKCAHAIVSSSKVAVDTDESKGDTNGSADENTDEVLDSLAVDPVFFKNISNEVVVATNEWVNAAGPPDRKKPYFDKEARKALKLNIVPWIKGSFAYFIGLVRNIRTALSPKAIRGVFQPPYYYADKASWCIDFTCGFTALVALGVYWEAFINLDNESWFLIAYAFSTTQTAEGTVKKGILRLLGTAAGGFSGWLAITACGEDGKWGLIAWLTVFTMIAAYIGLARGFKARMGLKPDYGFGPAYFVMTQALVVAQVHLGLGDKRTIAVNRISTNAVGIAIAIVLALLPPALYGGNPKFARSIMEEEKALMVKCLQLLLSSTESPEDGSAVPKTSIEDELQKIKAERATRISKLLDEANDFYTDSSKLNHFHLLKVDPKLKECLDLLQVIASWIYVSIANAVQVLKNEKPGEGFLQDSESRAQLEAMLQELQSGSGDAQFEKLTVQDEEHGSSGATKSIIFINCVVESIRKLQKVDKELETIKYGLCS